MRALLLFAIGAVFGLTAGFLAAGGTGDGGHAHDHGGHSDAGHDHSALVDWTGPAPDLMFTLSPDLNDDLNLYIDAKGFTFTPDAVNGQNVAGTGHAHVYVNGKKVARAYSPHLHLTNVPEGAVVRVTLNANDHAGWSLDGEPIAAEAIAP